MKTAEELRKSLEAIDELGSIVRTMKALSAVSIRQYEEAVRSLAYYHRTVELGLHVVLRKLGPTAVPRQRDAGGGLMAVVLGSDQGLCGRFNHEVVGYTRSWLESHGEHEQGVELVALGSRVMAQLESAGERVREAYPMPSSIEGIAPTAQSLLLAIERRTSASGIRRVVLFYSRQRDGAQCAPSHVQLLPVSLERFRRLEEQPWPTRNAPTFASEPETLFQALLTEYFFVTLHRACAESLASEHGSRLAAMRSAERRISERHDEMSMLFRQRRQGEITAELLDVVVGFEALTGSRPLRRDRRS